MTIYRIYQDEPAEEETVVEFRLVEEDGWVELQARNPGKGWRYVISLAPHSICRTGWLGVKGLPLDARGRVRID